MTTVVERHARRECEALCERLGALSRYTITPSCRTYHLGEGDERRLEAVGGVVDVDQA